MPFAVNGNGFKQKLWIFIGGADPLGDVEIGHAALQKLIDDARLLFTENTHVKVLPLLLPRHVFAKTRLHQLGDVCRPLADAECLGIHRAEPAGALC